MNIMSTLETSDEPVHHLRSILALMGTHDFSPIELTVLKGCRNGIPSYTAASAGSDTLFVGGSQGVVSVMNPRMSFQERLVFSLLGDVPSNFVQKSYNWYLSHMHQWNLDSPGSHQNLPFIDFMFETASMGIFTCCHVPKDFSTAFGTSFAFGEHLSKRSEDPSGTSWAVEELIRTNWEMTTACILALQSISLVPHLWRPTFLCMLDSGMADAFQYIQHLVVDPALKHRLSLAKFFTFTTSRTSRL